MSFRISKPRVADLRRGSVIGSRAESVACGICKKVVAKYSCPECNVPYCSLECYRAEGHRTCSEGFYKSSIEEEIRSAPERSIEEKKSMMAILQRMADPDAFPDDDPRTTSGDEEIESKLESLDLDSADTTALWDALSPAQRDAFTKAMQDPNSALARQLLDTTLESESNPWWDLIADQAPPIQPLQVPTALLETAAYSWRENRAVLIYNIIAVCLTYVFCIRSLGMVSMTTGDEYDREECRRVLAKAVPFMIDKKSTTRLDSVDDAIQYVQSRVDESLIHILPDVITLVRPSMVTEIPSSSLSLPSSNKRVADPKLCVVLADVSGLYTNLGPPNGPDKGMQTNKASGSTRDKGTVQKVLFYAAHVQAAPRDRLSSITHELYRASSSSMASSRQEDSISENITLLI